MCIGHSVPLYMCVCVCVRVVFLVVFSLVLDELFISFAQMFQLGGDKTFFSLKSFKSKENFQFVINANSLISLLVEVTKLANEIRDQGRKNNWIDFLFQK